MIEVYSYIEKDLDSMKFNHWARFLKSKKSIKNIKSYLNNAYSYTMFDNDKPIAILAFDEYEKGKYDGCIIADESFGDNPKYAIKMKKLVEFVIKKFDMKRVQTISEDSEKLNKWHEFLGFTLEKKDYWEYKGIKHNLWGMQWE